MIVPGRFNSVNWMLLAVLAVAPTAALAQQDKASQGQTQQQVAAAQSPTEAAQPKTEDAQRKTEAAQGQTQNDPKVISGMSILGNQEAPKALVIVPWKRSELGNALGVSTMLDDSKLPIDKEVFMRMLNYYGIRSETPGGASAKMDEAQVATAAQRRK